VAAALSAHGQTDAVVRVVDDFPAGIGAWTNADSGSLEWVADATGGGHLLWKAADDGIGRIQFKGVESLDLSAFDILRFRYRIAGKTLENMNPILQQYPFMQGFRAQYWSVDTLDVKLGEWQTYVQELAKVENSWPDSFSRTNQGFEFEVRQMPGAGKTTIELDDIVLERNVLGLERAYPGEWSAGQDGSQGYDFRIPIRNPGPEPMTVEVSCVSNSMRRGSISFMKELQLPPGGTGVVTAAVKFEESVVKASPPYYGEMASLAFTVKGTPLTLTALLPAGIRPVQSPHPSILCPPAHAAELRRQYQDSVARKNLNPIILTVAGEAVKALDYKPAYPPLGNMARDYTVCLMDKTNLVAVVMPNLPEATYQCPACGRFYRGLFYQAAMENWYGQHRANAAAAYHAGIGYMLTGEPAYAKKTAEILLGYKDTYLKMPVAALTAGVHAPIPSSGATRIAGSYMQEQNWLTQLSVGLDCIWDSGALTDAEKRELAVKVFEPSATLMMNHRVGLMNLQWMIDRAGVFAGLASENPALVARALYGDHGIQRLLDVGFLSDGMWRENPSYINVMANEGYPVLGTLFNNGILPYTPEMDFRYKAMWHLAAPDGKFPTLGTGGPPGLDILLNGVKAVAHLTDDPEMAWIDRRNPKVRNMGLYFSCVVAAFQAQGTRVPEDRVRPIVPVTTNLADYGVAVLRVPGTDAYAALAWGRHLVHGHYNKMSVNAYAKGGWFVRNMWGGYGKGFAEYVEPTASASTIMLDGRSQDADTGELMFLTNTPAAQLASAREIGAWKDAEHERTVALTADWMLVLDRVSSDKPHVMDWLYHGQGVSKTDTLAWKDGPGLVDGPPLRLTAASNSCFGFFEPVEGRALEAPVTSIRYARPNGSGLGLHLLKTGTALFRTGNATWPHEGLVFRQQAAEGRFVALFEPLGTNEAPRLSVETVQLVRTDTGKPAELREAQAAAVTAGGNRTIVAVNYAGVPLKTTDGVALKPGLRVQVVEP
jgi:hypothetical protein